MIFFLVVLLEVSLWLFRFGFIHCDLQLLEFFILATEFIFQVATCNLMLTILLPSSVTMPYNLTLMCACHKAFTDASYSGFQAPAANHVYCLPRP